MKPAAQRTDRYRLLNVLFFLSLTGISNLSTPICPSDVEANKISYTKKQVLLISCG
jgi:hypothetical protein